MDGHRHRATRDSDFNSALNCALYLRTDERLEDILVGADAGGGHGDLCRWSNSADYLILKQEDHERVTQFHA